MTPTLAKMPMAVKLIQPDICASRVEISPASAITPGLASPCCQSQRAQAINATGRAPDRKASHVRKIHVIRPNACAVSRYRATELSAASCSRPAWANNLTVEIWLRLSTSWPETAERASARTRLRRLIRGR